MKPQLDFQKNILDHLQAYSYVLIDPITTREVSSSMDILFKNEDVKSLLPKLKEITGLNNINVASSFNLTKSIFNVRDNVELMINFIHRFTYKSMVYLDAAEVLQRRVKTSAGFYIPCIEHLFEQRVIKSFLEMKGIGKAAFQYFNECHILVQEDLLDYFNMKYGTSFTSLYQLTDFDDRQRTQIIKHLKNTSSNGFIRTVKHTFMGFMRTAKII